MQINWNSIYKNPPQEFITIKCHHRIHYYKIAKCHHRIHSLYIYRIRYYKMPSRIRLINIICLDNKYRSYSVKSAKV